jgi:hypothetical protein
VFISSLPLDEDIHASAPPTHQEENMMICDPFEDLDDALFHDFGSKEVLEEPLDATCPFEKRKTKHYVLRINPLAMKRIWRGMSIKRNKNFDESQRVETSLFFLPLDVGEVVHPCFPLAHEVEEENSLNDEEYEDPIEAALTYAHKEKEMAIFNHIDDFMKEPLDSVDEHIDMFIQTRRRN